MKKKPTSPPVPCRGTLFRSKVFPDLTASNVPPETANWPVVTVVETGRQQVFAPLVPEGDEQWTRIVVVENGREVVYQSIGPAEVPPGAKAWPLVDEHDTDPDQAWLWPFLPRLRQWVATELGNRAVGVSADRVVRDVVVEVFAADAAERPPTFEALTGVARDQLSRLLAPATAS